MGAAIATVCAAYALKRFYSAASVEQLLWILQPVASLVSAATGCAFTYEAGFGFFARRLRS